MKKFETGGTADSAENGGANIGGTLGSSMMKRGGGLGEEFYEGQSIIMTDKSPYYDRMNKMMKRVVSPYINKELVIDKITKSKPHNLAKVFLRSSGEKAPFDVVLNKKYIQQYGNGGGTGVSSQTGYAEGTNADLLMNQDYLAYKKGGGVSKDKVFEVAYYGKKHLKQRGSSKGNYKTWVVAINREEAIEKVKNDDDEFAELKSVRPTNLDVERYKMANGGGLADVPESFPETDAMSYKKGGGVDAEDYYEQLAVYVQGVGSIYNGTSMKKAIEKANSYLKKNPKAEIVISDEKYGDTYDLYGNMIEEDEMANGGSTKGFEYSIGGL